ncbi:YSIRK-type signal peptide-containing protein [Lactobacillus sp.]|uniref:YSIRK-type signal peptide-containing protein n=1 Tax=Lactobacillus sp. TaxID=1591 RepID=UPI0019C70974|nr:YSIRK-type signal peptide-containing protein [Lactobacillus sp.]MBD5429644.1 YSIRK-type signal peptide-containing protein [Lactobacillus sp.]
MQKKKTDRFSLRKKVIGLVSVSLGSFFIVTTAQPVNAATNDTQTVSTLDNTGGYTDSASNKPSTEIIASSATSDR